MLRVFCAKPALPAFTILRAFLALRGPYVAPILRERIYCSAIGKSVALKEVNGLRLARTSYGAESVGGRCFW